MKTYSGNIDFFTRKLADELSPEETQEFSVWLTQSDANKAEFAEFENIWNSVDIIKGKESINVDAAWNRFAAEVQEQKSKIRFLRPLMAVAAVVTISMLSWFGYQLYFAKGVGSMVVTTAMNEQLQVALPDNSKISVNQNSRVSYSKTFKDAKERRIVLHGEAFFEVTPNKAQPFVVEINATRVKVLGTSFLISEDSIHHSVSVIVKTGRVAVYKEGSTDTIFLLPGERGEIVDVKKTAVKQVNSKQNYLSWKTKEFVFENAKCKDVIQQINEAYYSHIQIQGKELQECEITVSFKNKTIDEILEILQITLDITVEKQDAIIILKGKGC